MGNVHARRGRLAPALVLTFVVALVALGTLLVAEKANAQRDFRPTCAGCHASSTVHSSGNANHTGLSCATCHVNGSGAAGVAPSACAACHGGTKAILAKKTHSTLACGTTAGCHGVPSPTPSSTPSSTPSATPSSTPSATPSSTPSATPSATPSPTRVASAVSLRVGPKIIRRGKIVRLRGVAKPGATLKGKKVALKVQIKKGRKWVRVKLARATVSSTGAYSWKYKPLKRGSYRVRASIAASTTYKASRSPLKAFRVK